MYLPAATSAGNMALGTTEDPLQFAPEVSQSTATSIYIRWNLEALKPFQIRGFMVQFHERSSDYIRTSKLLPPTTDSYGIRNLVADTYYRVCVTMVHNGTQRVNECVDANTASWHIPVSIGSSIGAVLALSIIVLIVLLSRCPNLVRQPRTAAAESSKYDSVSSHFPEDRYEMSDTTTHCHDDDVFSQSSDGDVSGDHRRAGGGGSAGKSHHHHYHNHHHQSPLSLAERVCNGKRVSNGVGKLSGRMPMARVGRTLSLTERRGGHPAHRARQARLAHFHANFHSIQSEPGGIPSRATVRISIPDLPSSSSGTDTASTDHTSSMPDKAPCPDCPQLKGAANCSGCNCKPVGYKNMPRLPIISSAATAAKSGASSEPSVLPEDTKVRPPILKDISKTQHMSLENDTYV